MQPYDKGGNPTDIFAFEPLTITSSSAVAFTAATHDPVGPTSGKPAISAHTSIEGGSVRWRADGTDPTTSVGTLLNDGDELLVWGRPDITSMRFIATAGDVTGNVHYAR